MKILKISLGIFFGLVMAFPLFAQHEIEAEKILFKMSEKYKQTPAFKAKFVYELSSPGENISDKYEGEILVKQNKYHLTLGSQEIFNNEKNVWTYLVDDNEVTITEYEKDPEDISPTEMPDLYKEGYKYRFVKETKVDKIPCEVVELQPEDTDLSYFKILLTIEKDDKTLRSWKVFYKDNRTTEYHIRDFAPQTNLSDNLFVFQTDRHPNVEVVDLR